MEQLTQEQKRQQATNRRLALRSATSIAVALLNNVRTTDCCDKERLAKSYMKSIYKFNLKLLDKA